MAPALLRSLRAQSAICPEFPQALRPLEGFSLPFPQMINIDAFLAPCSSALLLSLLGIQQPSKSSSVDSSFSFTELKELPSPCAVCTISQCPSGRVSSSHRTFSSSGLLCTYASAQCPLGRALQNSQQNFVCNCVLSYTALPLEVFNNLKGLLPELLTLVCSSACLCLTPHEFRSASTVHWDSESQHSVTPSWHEPSKTSQT